MKIDSDFVKGVAYYIGDGRMTAPRSLSTVNNNIEIIKFFLKWLDKYFNIKLNKIKIKIKPTDPNYDKSKIKKEISKNLGIKERYIHSVSMKENSKPHHKLLIEIWANNAKAKRVFNNIIPIVKNKCMNNKNLALGYVKGIMAAEGSPKYSIKSGSKSIHLKMKNEEEIRYIGNLLNNVLKIKSSILRVRTEEEMWLITISGFYELNKLDKLNIFEIESDKRQKFRKMIDSYKRAHVKKGDVNTFYTEKLKFYNQKYKKNFTAPELAKIIGRDKTRVINVLRQLEKEGLIKSERRKTTGRPFEFWIQN